MNDLEPIQYSGGSETDKGVDILSLVPRSEDPSPNSGHLPSTLMSEPLKTQLVVLEGILSRGVERSKDSDPTPGTLCQNLRTTLKLG